MAFRVGLVGTGGIARAHGNATQQIDDAILQAVCDVSEESVNSFGDQFKVSNRYTDLDQMLKSEDLDIAIICTWGAFHEKVGVQIANSGRVKAILCEKPFTSTAEEAERLVAAARKNNVLLAEAFKFRHHPMHLKAQELIDSGAIGEVMSVRSTFCTGGGGGGPETRRPEQNWRFNKAKGGGSIYDLACYNLHHARTVYKADPVRVFASQQAGLEVDDGAYILLVFPNDRTAQISVGFNSWGSQYGEINGTAGSLRLDKIWNNEGQNVKLEFRSKDHSEDFDFEPTFQFAHQLQHLCDSLSTGQPHRIPPENSINQMYVIDAVYESMNTGRSVALDLS
jgi:predicted dehydrogenase